MLMGFNYIGKVSGNQELWPLLNKVSVFQDFESDTVIFCISFQSNHEAWVFINGVFVNGVLTLP